MKRFAYVSLLTTDEYLPGIVVLHQCLKLSRARFPFFVCVTKQLSGEILRALHTHQIETIEIDEISITSNSVIEERKWLHTFTKLRIFSLTQFDKLVFLDADMLICDNLDGLFDCEHMSAVNAGGYVFPWNHLNSGLMVVEPKNGEFEAMIRTLRSGGNFQNDQEVIQACFPSWPWKRSLNLGHIYNVFERYLTIGIEKEGLHMIDDVASIPKPKKEQCIKVIHFVYNKPWREAESDDPYYDRNDKNLQRAYELWGAIRK